MVGDNSATINSLQSGKTYTIKLTAVRDSGGESIRNTLLLNVTTLIPTMSNIRLHHLNNDMSMVTFSWEAPPMHVSSFVIKYREIDSITQHDYITIEVPGTNTTVNIPDMNPGKSYEFQFYSKLGNLRSDVVKVTAEIPFRQTPERHCQDPDTHEIFAIGQHWISKAGEFLLNCTCHGPSTFDCNTGEWCHTDNGVFNVSDTWRQVNDENNKKEECVCNGRTGYTCFPRNCQDGDNWFDEGEPWISAIDGYICNCICPSDLHAPCRTTCRPQTTNQNVNLEEE
uniref:Fibronectin type-III domain-containing protein n=1 Tax=Ciona savignyi TaxID=51511 RepID=H2ZJT6_CIOSA